MRFLLKFSFHGGEIFYAGNKGTDSILFTKRQLILFFRNANLKFDKIKLK